MQTIFAQFNVENDDQYKAVADLLEYLQETGSCVCFETYNEDEDKPNIMKS
jgi:hypothetical protein